MCGVSNRVVRTNGGHTAGVCKLEPGYQQRGVYFLLYVLHLEEWHQMSGMLSSLFISHEDCFNALSFSSFVFLTRNHTEKSRTFCIVTIHQFWSLRAHGIRRPYGSSTPCISNLHCNIPNIRTTYASPWINWPVSDAIFRLWSWTFRSTASKGMSWQQLPA